MDYHKILQRSWEIIKREKVLWIFGMVLAAFSGGGSVNIGDSLDKGFKLFQEKEKIPSETGEKVAQVLGEAVANPQDFFLTLFSSIPLTFWIALALGIFLLIFFSLLLGIFLRNWATGALFRQALAATRQQQLSLAQGSQQGLQCWKRLFLVSLVIKGGFIVISILTFLFLGLLFFFAPGVLKVFAILLLALAVLLFLVFIIITSLWEAFAELVVALEDYQTKQAISFAWQLTKRFFWQGVIMGIINIGLGCFVGCLSVVIYAIIAGIIVVGFVINMAVGLILLVSLGIPLLILFLGSILISGILRAFTSCNWVVFYQELKEKEEFQGLKINF